MQDELCNKSEALDNLIKMLKQPNTCEALEPGPAALLFEALFACQHLDVLHFLADVRKTSHCFLNATILSSKLFKADKAPTKRN